MQAAAPSDEEGWISAGERQNMSGIVVTIERQTATLTMTGWSRSKNTESGMWRYEHSYSFAEPEQVADDICKILALPADVNS
jgi:hypothetical protein